MISRSVAQIATASIRTNTSAFFGTGTGFCFRVNCPGSPSTHARMVSGIARSGLVFTPAGAYIACPFGMGEKVGTRPVARARSATQGRNQSGPVISVNPAAYECRRLGYMRPIFERYNCDKPDTDPEGR